MRQIFFILTLLSLLLLEGCKSKDTVSMSAFTKKVYTPGYATGFEIVGTEHSQSTIIRVFNPWQGAQNVEMLYFVARNGEHPPRDFSGVTIQGGVRRIVCMSSSYVAMLNALGQTERVVGVSGMDFISNPYVLANKGKIKDVGAEINYEILVGLAPDLVLLYGIGDAQSTVTDKLKELHIPYMYMGEYLEESPLGKAEWLVAVAELMNSRDVGETVFQAIPQRYQALKQLAAGGKNRPTVMLNTPWNDNWVMPSVKSYMAQLIADAGGDYIYKKNVSNSSQPIGLETAYSLIREADVWLNVGMATTLGDLQSMNPQFKDAKAIQEGKVYNNNLRLTTGGGNEFWESSVVCPDIVLRDLIRIFHPELVSDDLYYYRRLE